MKAVINVTLEAGVKIVKIEAPDLPFETAATLVRVLGAAASGMQHYGRFTIAYESQAKNDNDVRHGFCTRCMLPCFVFAGRCGGCDFEAEPNPDKRRPLKAEDCSFDLALVAGGTVEVTGGSDGVCNGWWQKHGEWMVPIAPPLRNCGCIPGPEHCADHRRRTGGGVVLVSTSGRAGDGGPHMTCLCPCHPV